MAELRDELRALFAGIPLTVILHGYYRAIFAEQPPERVLVVFIAWRIDG